MNAEETTLHEGKAGDSIESQASVRTTRPKRKEERQCALFSAIHPRTLCEENGFREGSKLPETAILALPENTLDACCEETFRDKLHSLLARKSRRFFCARSSNYSTFLCMALAFRQDVVLFLPDMSRSHLQDDNHDE